MAKSTQSEKAALLAAEARYTDGQIQRDEARGVEALLLSSNIGETRLTRHPHVCIRSCSAEQYQDFWLQNNINTLYLLMSSVLRITSNDTILIVACRDLRGHSSQSEAL